MSLTDWQTISSLATAGGTLILAVATFTALHSSNRSARIAEEGYLSGVRPLLVYSLERDPVRKVEWMDRRRVDLAGGQAVFEQEGGVIYLAMGLRNEGAGIALLHGWHLVQIRHSSMAGTQMLQSSGSLLPICMYRLAVRGTGRVPSGTLTTPSAPAS